jgi:hypothetical protein
LDPPPNPLNPKNTYQSMNTKAVGILPLVAVALAGSGTVQAAAVTVDWLELGNGATASSFALTGDTGLSVAHGALEIQTGKGISFPGFPTGRTFQSEYWSAPTGFLDSVTGDAVLRAFDLRVVPQAGSAAYTVKIDVPAGQELVFAIGGLFRDLVSATDSVAISAGGGAMLLSQTVTWDGGTGSFDQDLEWNAASGTLSTTVGASGDSQFAFFRISSLAGPTPQLTFTIPNGYAAGLGDEISIAVGTVVPEPEWLGLIGLGTLVWFVGRPR